MAEWNEHVLNVRARLDKASKQEMIDSVRDVFTEGAHIDFKSKENLRGLHELADIMRKVFSAAGNNKFDFSKMITLPGPELFDGLKEAAKEFDSVWSAVIQKFDTHSLKDFFMQDLSALDSALQRVGKSANKVKGLEKAFKVDTRLKDPDKILERLKATQSHYTAADNINWEDQYADLLQYIKLYEKYVTNAEADVSKGIMEQISQIGPYTYKQLKEAEAQISTSLDNIFRHSRGESLIGLTGGGRIDFEAVPKVVKTLNVGDILGGKKNIEVPIDLKVKLDEFYSAFKSGNKEVRRRIETEISTMFPEDIRDDIIDRLWDFGRLPNVNDRNYNAIYKDFVKHGLSVGDLLGGFGSGDGTGTGDASSAELEAANVKIGQLETEVESLKTEIEKIKKKAAKEPQPNKKMVAHEEVLALQSQISERENEISALKAKLEEKSGSGTGNGTGGFALSDDEIENRLSKIDELKQLMSRGSGMNYDDPTSSYPDYDIKRLTRIKELYSEITGEKDTAAIDAIDRAIDKANGVLEDLKRYKEKIKYDPEGRTPDEIRSSAEEAMRVRMRWLDDSMNEFEKYMPSHEDFADKEMIRRHQLSSQILEPNKDDFYEIEGLEEILENNKLMLAQLEKENLLTDEMRAKYDAINESIEKRINYQKEYSNAVDAAEKSLDELDTLYDKISATDDPDEVNTLLEERKRILSEISTLVQDDYAESIESAIKENSLIEKRIALLRDANAGKIDIYDVDDILKEGGDLESKLERLQDVSSGWGSQVKDNELDEDDDALESLREFEETYDRIVLKLSNGRNIEILPNAKGLRALYKYADGMDSSVYGESEIADVEFVRKEMQQASQETQHQAATQVQANDTEIESNKEKIKSYEELSAAVSRYIELAKTLVDTEKMTPEHKQIQKDMDVVDMWGIDGQEDYITAINEQQEKIKKIKAAIKIGAEQYKTDDGYVEQITEDTLGREESILRGYIYQYAENFDDIDTLLVGAKTKTLKNIITKEVGKFVADQDIQVQHKEIADAANAVALEEMEAIEKSIENSSLEGKSYDAWSKLTELKNRVGKVDRFTQSAETDAIANDLGIVSPHKEIEDNAKAIKSYEELCSIVERYIELQHKRYVYTGDEYPTLNADEENEFAELKGRLNATKDGVQLTWREIEGDINKLAQLLGIEIPQASQQAAGAVNQLNNELAETGNKADNIGGQSGDGQIAGATAEEVNNLEAIRKKTSEITTEVKEKNQAFLTEQSVVKKVAESEVHALGEVEKKVNAIRVALSNVNTLMNNIKQGKDVNAGLSNINVNVSHKNENISEKAPWAKDETLRNLTNRKLENIISNTKTVKIDKSGLATNDVLNRVAQATEAMVAKKQAVQTQVLDPASIISPIIIVVKDICTALSNAESAVNTFGNKVSLFNQQNMVPAPQPTGKNKTPANTPNGNNGKKGNVYSVKTLEVVKAGNIVVDKTLTIEKSKTSDAIVTTSTLEDENGGFEHRITERSYGKFEAEKAKEEERAIKELLKSYERLGELRAKRDMLPKSALRDDLQKEIKLENSRLWKQSKKLGVDSATTKEASALGEHNVQMDQLITKTRLLGQYQKNIISMEQGSESYNNAQKRISELASEIELIQKKIALTQEEKIKLDELLKKNEELKKIKSADQSDRTTKSNNAERAKEIKNLTLNYEKLGRMRAEFEDGKDLGIREELRVLAEQVEQKRKSLGLTIDEILALREKSSEAYKTEQRLIAAAKQQQDIDDQRRAADKAEKDRLKEQEKQKKKEAANAKKLAQREAMLGKAGSAVGRAETTWMNAIGIEGLPAGLVTEVDEYYNKLDALRKKHQELKNSDMISDEQKQELIDQTMEINKLTEEIGELISEYQKLSGDNAKVIGTNTLDENAGLSGYEKQLKQAVITATNGKAQIKGFDAATKTLTYTIKTGKNEFTEYTAAVRHLDNQLVSIQGETKRTETFIEATMRKMKEISSYMSGMSLISRAVQELRRGIQYVREIDLALTELKKVTDETEESYDQFLKTAAQTGARLGSTISAVTEATATFAKLGYTMEQATEMAEAAIVYKNVGDNIASTEDAADSIISTMKGFGLEVTESMAIVDKFNEVGNRFAITSQGIGEALRLSASALHEGGNTLNESIGLITAANEVVNDPSSVGTALKTLTLRLRGSKTELEEMGEDVSDMATTTSALQAKLLALTGGKVDIMLDANTFKNSTQILREMAAAWSDMNDIQRASALELMGGKRQANVLSALISNFDTVENAIEASANSAGSALEENERYLDSIQGKTDQFNNALQSMWSNALDSDLVKGFVNFGTILIKIIDKVGLLNSALIALSTYSMIKHKQGPIAFLGEISKLITDGSSKVKGYITNMMSMIAANTAVAQSTELATVGSLKNAMAVAKVDIANKNAILSQLGLAGANNTQTISRDSLTASTLGAIVAEGKLTQTQANTIMSLLGIQAATNEVNAARMNEILVAAGLERTQRAQIITQLGLSGSVKNLTKDSVLQAMATAGLDKTQQTAILSALGLTGANTGLAASFSALWTAMWPILAVMAGVAIIYGVVKAFDAVVVTTAELEEKLDDLNSEISEIESELDSLNSELETTQDRMEELLSKDSLSFTEEEELKNLKLQNAELERRIKLEEMMLKEKEEEAKDTAKEVIKKKWDSKGADKSYYIDGSGEIYEDKWNKSGKNTKKILDQAMKVYKTNSDLYTRYQNILGNWSDTDKEANKALLKEFGFASWDTDHNDPEYFKSLIKDELLPNVNTAKQGQARGINMVLGDMSKIISENGLSYSIGDEDINKFLDEYYAYSVKWANAQGIASKSSVISAIWDNTESEAMAILKENLDEISNSDSADKQVEAQQLIQNALDDTTGQYERLQTFMGTVGVTAKEMADYFVAASEAPDISTPEGMTEVYQDGINILGKYKDARDEALGQDENGENITWNNLFTTNEDGKRVADNLKIAAILEGSDEDIREEFTKMVEAVENGEMEVNEAISKFSLSGLIQVAKQEEAKWAEINKSMFKGLDDEISGWIDSFSELSAALEDVANSMDLIHTANEQMASSGQISVKTALELMNSTDNWNQLLEIQDGKIRLNANAEEILVQSKLNTIKAQNAEAISSINLQLAQMGAIDTAVVATEASDITTEAYAQYTEAMDSYAASIAGFQAAIGALLNGENPITAYQNARNVITSQQKTQRTVDIARLTEQKAELEEQKKMLEVIDKQGFENIYDYNETPGDKYGKDDKSKTEEALDAFQRAMDYWENRIGANQARYEQLQNEIDLLESKGQKADASYYEEQIKLENERLSLLQQQKAEAQSFLGTFTEGSEEWWEVANTLNDIESELDSVAASIVDLQDAIGEIDTYKFEEFNTRLDNLVSKLGTIRDLIAPDESDWFDDQGEWTESGVAVLGSYVQELELYKQGLEETEAELNKYNKAYSDNTKAYYEGLGIHSEQEYYEKVEELTEQQYDFASSISDTEQSIVGMYESSIDAVEEYINTLIEGYSDYIDSVKEALDAERDLYEFKKNVQKQAKDIAEIERRIASLSGSTNKSEIAERRKLEAQLYEARESLNDTYYDHAKDSQNAALDAEQTAYEETMNKFIENMRTSLETATQDMDKFLGNVTTMVSLNAGAILQKYQETEVPLDDALTNPWEAAKTAVGDYDGDALALMDTWATNGFLTTFPETVKGSLTSPWTAGQSAVDAFKTSVDTQMKNVVSTIETNVKTASGKLSELYKQIKDTEQRAANVGSGAGNGGDQGGYVPPQTPPTPKMNASGVNSSSIRIGTKADADKKKETLDGASYIKWTDGYYYLASKVKFLFNDVDEKGKKKAVYGIPAGTTRYKYYAKGTTGTTRDQFALTDEPQFGDELVLVPGKDGNLSFMRKGTGVVPADMTQKLWELAQIPTSDLMRKNITAIVPDITKTDIKNEFSFDSLVHVDHCDQNTLKDLEKMVDNKINDFSKQMNYSLKKFTR